MAARKNAKAKADSAGDGVQAHGGEAAEVSDEVTQVVEFAAGIDVAKGFGMVCTRVPGSRAGRRRQKVWRVNATFSEVTALMDHLVCEGIQRLVLESTSDYWRIWYYLAEAAGLEVWLVNARDVKHLPGRAKSDRADCVWLCKLNERGMLRRSFVPPRAVRDLRMLTRTRSRLAQDQARHQARVEKILEDALLKVSSVISDLFGVSGRLFLDALVAGERSPAALAALGDYRLKASKAMLEETLTGQFRDIHAEEIAVHLRLIDAINAEITGLDAKIEQLLPQVPRTAPACTACGLAGGGHAPDCTDLGVLVLGLADRLDEITGIGAVNARVLIAELGTDPSQFATPGHAAAWAKLTSRMMQSGESSWNGRAWQRQPVPARRARPGRDERSQDRHPAGGDVPADRPQARQAESHRRGRPRHLRDRLDPHLRPRRPLHRARPGLLPAPQRQTADQVQHPPDRERQPRQEGHPHRRPRHRPSRRASGTGGVTPAPRNTILTRHLLRCHATGRNLGRSPAALAAKLPRVAGCCSLVGDCFRSGTAPANPKPPVPPQVRSLAPASP